jgi:hypothetical protein
MSIRRDFRAIKGDALASTRRPALILRGLLFLIAP